MPTNLKFPVFVLTVNISLFTSLLFIKYWKWVLPGHDLTNGQKFQHIVQAITSIFRYSYCLDTCGKFNLVAMAYFAALNSSLIPRPRVRGESGLVSTVCACANDFGNFSRMSPITDKLHVVVLRRNNQARYTACSVAAVYVAMAPLSVVCLTETQSKHSFGIFTAKGKKQGWARHIGVLLEVPVSSDGGFPTFFCRGCRSKLLCIKSSFPVQQRANFSVFLKSSLLPAMFAR